MDKRFQDGKALNQTGALLVVAAIAPRIPGKTIAVAGWSFIAGIAVFSGSLYVLAVTGVRVLGELETFRIPVSGFSVTPVVAVALGSLLGGEALGPIDWRIWGAGLLGAALGLAAAACFAVTTHLFG